MLIEPEVESYREAAGLFERAQMTVTLKDWMGMDADTQRMKLKTAEQFIKNQK